MPILPWLIISVQIIVVIMWLIMIRRQVKCVKDKLHKDMLTNRHGLVDRHGRFMGILLVIVIHMIKSILIRRKRCIILSLPIRICRKILYRTGTLMLLIFRMNHAMLLLLPVRPQRCMSWKLISPGITIRQQPIRSWKVLAHRLIVQQWAQTVTLS